MLNNIIFINTNLAACGGVLAAAIVTRLMIGKTDVLQMLNGAIGGLVAITAEPLMPTPLTAILIGSVGGIIVIFGTKLLFFFKIDDVVGAIPAHLFAGVWGYAYLFALPLFIMLGALGITGMVMLSVAVVTPTISFDDALVDDAAYLSIVPLRWGQRKPRIPHVECPVCAEQIPVKSKSRPVRIACLICDSNLKIS